MGRSAEGWKLHWKGGPPPIGYVRFRHEGHRYDLSTGERDPVRAAKAAPGLYSDVISGRYHREKVLAAGARLPLAELTAMWLADFEASHATGTPAIFKGYVKTWLEFFGEALGTITTESIASFTNKRLREVLRTTVRKERSALRLFLAWCGPAHKKLLAPDELPVFLDLPKTATGVRKAKRKEKAVELGADEVRAFLAALPEWSGRNSRARGDDREGKPYSIRARFTVAWETSLRPRTLDQLSVPRHYRKGAAELHITEDIDKARYERTVKLSARAREALDSVCPEEGLIFGRHDFRNYLRAAAKKSGMAPAKVDLFTAYDLRHARATYLLDLGASLLGTGFVLGHKQATTTNRYLRATKREGDRAIDLDGGSAAPPGEDTGAAEDSAEE